MRGITNSTIEKTLGGITPADPAWREKARARIATLTMRPWALGRLLDLSVDLAGMTRSLTPVVARRVVVVMAGDHGVVAEGVSAFPQEVTVQMVQNFVGGGAGINVLADQAGARVVVVDVGVAGDLNGLVRSDLIYSRRVAPGTGNIAVGPAMSREQALCAVATGIDIAADLADASDLFVTGEMGIGNTTPSSAIVSLLCGISPDEAMGSGTGLDARDHQKKSAVVSRSLAVNRPSPSDPIDILAKVGGFEIGAIAGLILGAAAQCKPVLIDGFISTAGALLAQGLAPASTDYMIAAHRSAEPGHDAALLRLDKRPLLDLGLRLGEGTGAALAMHLVEVAVRVLSRMATFEEAGVSGADG
jgi:nicotinate-nucleotide--dimethylbenzimidazole phosphoribosyltransferase